MTAPSPARPDAAPAAHRHPVPSPDTVERLASQRERLVGLVLRRVEADYPWYRALSAEDRSWVGMVAQSSVVGFIAWCDEPDSSISPAAEAFSLAPSELTKTVSLHHTLQLVRSGVDVIEEQATSLSAPGQAAQLREAILRFSRDFAFKAAEVYARAAEVRGSWDARLEALLVDGLVRGEDGASLRSRASALGWKGDGPAFAIVAATPTPLRPAAIAALRRTVREVTPDALLGIQADRIILVLGGPGDMTAAANTVAAQLAEGAVVVGPEVAGLEQAATSIRSALAGLDALVAYPGAPRPVLADDLLPERILAGDPDAAARLIETAYAPIAAAGGELIDTLAAYLATGRSLEASARILYVHPNTVRYRLRKVADELGWDPADPREAFALQVALVVGRLAAAS